MNKISLDVMFKCEKSEGEDGSSIVKFVADPIVTSAPFLNENNFVFSKETLEKNMLTMNNKPLNFMHDSSFIVGHCQRCTSSTNLSDELIGKGAYALKASGTFYKGLNQGLYDDIVNSESGFKVSIEARTKDLSWILFDSREGFSRGEYEKVSPSEDPDLHAIGRFYLWMFGSVNGLSYKEKMVAVELGGINSEMEFVGLALTDERFGSMAADQNTAFRVHATREDASFSMTEVALAVMNMNSEKLEEIGIDVEQASKLCEMFKQETSDGLVDGVPESVELEGKITSTEGSIGGWKLSSDGNDELNGVVVETQKVLGCSVPDNLAELIASIKSEVVLAISNKEISDLEISNLTDKVESLLVEVEQLKEEIVKKDELVLASKLELEATVSQFDSCVKEIEKKTKEEIEVILVELDKLRRFELTQSDMCSAESIIELNLGSMTAEEYSNLKKGFSVTEKKGESKSKKQVIDYWSHIAKK